MPIPASNLLETVEAQGLPTLGFSLCYYVELYCPSDGVIRLGIAERPEEKTCRCPKCGRLCQSSGLLATGLTLQSPPFFWIVAEPLSASRLGRLGDDDVQPSPRPTHRPRASQAAPRPKKADQYVEKRHVLQTATSEDTRERLRNAARASWARRKGEIKEGNQAWAALAGD